MELTPPFPIDELSISIVRDLGLSADEERLFNVLIKRDIPPLVTTRVLSLILGVSHKLLWAMASEPERYYRRFELPKKSGGSRQIATPRVFLKVVQRWILVNILYRRTLPPFVTGFVPGRGLLTNASFHLGRRYLTRLDIESFFPSIRTAQVETIYRDFGFPYNVVSLLAKLSMLDGALPQGAPTSPSIANLVFLHCDTKILEVADKFNVEYSRYADDLTFSSDDPITPQFIEAVIALVEESSFRVNMRKLSVAGPGQRLETTGLVVHTAPHPVRTLRRRLRARFHQAEASPELFCDQAHQLLGWAAFVNMYDGELGARYIQIARTVQRLSQK